MYLLSYNFSAVSNLLNTKYSQIQGIVAKYAFVAKLAVLTITVINS